MFVLLLILGAALCTGNVADNHSEENYGSKIRIRLHWKAHTLTFFRDGSSDGTVLWNRYNSDDTMDRRGEKLGVFYVIDLVTQQDSGRYEVRDRNNELLSVKSITVIGHVSENHSEENYGGTIEIPLPRRAQSLTFFRDGSSDWAVLWNRSNSAGPMNRRGKNLGSVYVIDKLTQRDSGRYEVRDRNNDRLSVTSITVIGNTKTIELASYESFHFDFNLEKSSCNIKFVPLTDSLNDGIDIVRNGRLRWHSDGSFCEGLQYVSPCEILHDEVTKSCDGHFEVNDADGNRAWQLGLYVTSPPFDATPIIISSVVLCATIICCCCVRRCCCKKSSSKEGQQHDNEPVLLRRTDYTEPSETLYPAQANAPTGPLIHNPPTVNVPPAYSEVSAPAEPTHAPTFPPSYAPTVPPSYAPTVFPSYAPTVPPSFAPTVPISCAATTPSSEFEPRFELKNFAYSSCSPLSSDSTEVSVYNSDKLNFL